MNRIGCLVIVVICVIVYLIAYVAGCGFRAGQGF
jgi:hypothetical protein